MAQHDDIGGSPDSITASRRQAAARRLSDLFRGKTAQEWREAYSGAFDWGPDVGREVIAD
jgi:hypothetical protein